MKLSISLYDNDRTVETLALIDSGAKGGNFIDQKFLNTHHIPYWWLKKGISVRNADGTSNQNGTIQKYVETTIEIEGRVCQTILLVTSLGQETVILGYPWLKRENPSIDWEQQTLTWRNEESSIHTLDPTEITVVFHSIRQSRITEPLNLAKCNGCHGEIWEVPKWPSQAHPNKEIFGACGAFRQVL